MANITNNRLNINITAPDQAASQQHFNDLRSLFPFLVGLASSEKQEMNGINVANKQWVEDCIVEMEQDPSLLPGFITPQQVKTDLQLFEQLEVIKVDAADFHSRISDTQYLAGAEAYAVCLIYYKILEAAAKAGLPGANERYNRLKERFTQSNLEAENKGTKAGGQGQTPPPPPMPTPEV